MVRKIYKLRKTPYYNLKPEIACQGFGWFETNVGYKDLKRAGILFKEITYPDGDSSTEYWKYGQNVFRVDDIR